MGGYGDRRDIGDFGRGGSGFSSWGGVPLGLMPSGSGPREAGTGLHPLGESAVVVVDSAGQAQVLPAGASPRIDPILSEIVGYGGPMTIYSTNELMNLVGVGQRKPSLPLPSGPPITGLSPADQWAADLIRFSQPPIMQDPLPGGMGPGGSYGSGGGVESTPTRGSEIQTGTGAGEMATDWGDLLGNLATTYVQSRFAPVQAQPAILPALPAIPGAISGLGSVLGGLGLGAGIGELMELGGGTGLGLPGIDIVGTGDSTKGKLYNPRTGKWERCRRRRRKLLTDGDFKCLASLKTLTGNNDAFKAAVVRAVR